MRAALIGDVHGNLHALQAVLKHAESQYVDVFWNIGDFVGYGPHPDEVVRLIRKVGAVSIIGNYDSKVLRIRARKTKWIEKKQPEKRLAFEWAYDNLSDDSREYLSTLPETIRMRAEGRRVILVHGSPDSPREHLTPNTPDSRLRDLASMTKADTIVCGHSHVPFHREVDGVHFINTGSVGRPDDGDPRACYAVLEISCEKLSVTHHRVEYDVQQAVDAIKQKGLPAVFAKMLAEGRSLNSILGIENGDSDG